MKSAKFFSSCAFIVVLAACISAQNIQYPNELKGYRFYHKGKLKNLNITASKLADWKSVFGKDCSAVCDLSKNWKIYSYLADREYPMTTIENGFGRKIFLHPQYENTLWKIELMPKKRVSFRNIHFPEVFHKVSGFISEINRSFDVYKDPQGLSYWIFAEDAKGYEKGNLYRIVYSVPDGISAEYYDLAYPVD